MDRMIGRAVQKMITFFGTNIRDTEHFLKVYAMARTIGEGERLPGEQQQTLELAAIVHDIACPLCRERYGHANGKAQEQEGPPLAAKFLAELGCDEGMADRVCYLVAHHHTYADVDGMDYQILLEADLIVNVGEGNVSASSVPTALQTLFRTETGRRLLCSMYPSGQTVGE